MKTACNPLKDPEMAAVLRCVPHFLRCRHLFADVSQRHQQNPKPSASQHLLEKLQQQQQKPKKGNA